MNTAEEREDKNRKPSVPAFGGCRRLLAQYKTVGHALLSVEHLSDAYRSGAQRNFEEDVAFIPLEVLESYLEDLLDLEITDGQLFIVREPGLRPSLGLSGAMLSMVAAVAMFAFTGNLVLLAGFAFVSLMSFLLHMAETPHGAVRRVSFARVLSCEVSRRRGEGGDAHHFAWTSTRFDIKGLFGQSEGTAIHGAARKIVCH